MTGKIAKQFDGNCGLKSRSNRKLVGHLNNFSDVLLEAQIKSYHYANLLIYASNAYVRKISLTFMKKCQNIQL